MKTTEKLFKTLLMSLLLVSCLGTNAMAEENHSEEDNMNVSLTLQSSFLWNIPECINLDLNTQDEEGNYIQDFNIEITDATLKPNEEVQIKMNGADNNQFTEDNSLFIMNDDNNPSNHIRFYIAEQNSQEKIAKDQMVLSANSNYFKNFQGPLVKTLQIVMKDSSSLKVAGTYNVAVKFSASIVTQ